MTNIDRIKKLGNEWKDRIKNVNPENLREDIVKKNVNIVCNH